MPVTNYYTANGQIIAEATSGVRTDYLMDALGSVTATVNQSGAIVNTYRHKPYGGLLTKTGVGSDPAFLWVGSQGYRQTSKKYSEVYIRARHYSSTVGRWTTKDPIGLEGGDLNFYRYVASSPIGQSDPSGMTFKSPHPTCSCEPPIVNGITKTDRRYKCYRSACVDYCARMADIITDAEDACKPPERNCKAMNDLHKPCNQQSPYWSVCGQEICDPAGCASNGANANKSHWPKPKPQIGKVNLPWGGEYCCVECKMRFCCYAMDLRDPVWVLSQKLKRCDNKSLAFR